MVKPTIYNHGNMMSLYVMSSKEYLVFQPVEYLFSTKHFLKILWKFKHFPWRYKRKLE